MHKITINPDRKDINKTKQRMKKSYEQFKARQELLGKQYDETYYQKQNKKNGETEAFLTSTNVQSAEIL